jgi:hypothetical protein
MRTGGDGGRLVRRQGVAEIAHALAFIEQAETTGFDIAGDAVDETDGVVIEDRVEPPQHGVRLRGDAQRSVRLLARALGDDLRRLERQPVAKVF